MEIATASFKKCSTATSVLREHRKEEILRKS